MTSVTEEMIEAACEAFYGDAAWASPRGYISPPSSRIAMSRALEAALSASPAAQTGDWVLVPREPTQDMLDEADRKRPLPELYIREVYAALIAAAPQPTEPVAFRKPKHPAAVEPFFIDAEHRTEGWMQSVFTVPLYVSPVAQQRDDGWQDIATAPKDGTRLDLWAGDRRIPDVRWVDEAQPDECGFTYGWVNAAGHYVLGEDEEPEFWMRGPLPPSPPSARTSQMGELSTPEGKLVEDARYFVGNPSAWPEGYDPIISHAIRGLIDALSRIAAERDGLREANEHANRMQRLTMDHRQAAERERDELKAEVERLREAARG